MLNSIDELDNFEKLICQVIENILLNPTEEKYRTLKTSNAAVKTKLLGISGGNELLHALGFRQRVNDENITVLVLEEGKIGKDLQYHLSSVKDWLKHNFPIFRTFAATGLTTDRSGSSSSIGSSERICCDIVVNVRLPTGSTVSGGFLAGDTIVDVIQFVSTYFASDR